MLSVLNSTIINRHVPEVKERGNPKRKDKHSEDMALQQDLLPLRLGVVFVATNGGLNPPRSVLPSISKVPSDQGFAAGTGVVGLGILAA